MAEWQQLKAPLMRATKFAAEQGSSVIGTQHLLIGALHETQDQAVRVLADRGVTWQAVERECALSFAAAGSPRALIGADLEARMIPFTPKAQRALDTALMMSERPTAGHLLMGILQLEDDIAAGMLIRILGAREGGRASTREIRELVRAAIFDEG